jgi:colanic acid/amylovoran biosynthesis protein
MVTHTSPKIGQNYIDFFKKVFLETKTNGRRITLLNHAGERDDKICQEIKDQLDSDVELFSRPNALEAKGIIGASSLVISSRFHGAASALSQAVPCLVSGWSHKYLMLLKDYDLENGLLDLSDESAALNKVREFIDKTVNKQLRDHLAKKSKTLKKKSEEMWNHVFEIIDGTKA